MLCNRLSEQWAYSQKPIVFNWASYDVWVMECEKSLGLLSNPCQIHSAMIRYDSHSMASCSKAEACVFAFLARGGQLAESCRD